MIGIINFQPFTIQIYDLYASIKYQDYTITQPYTFYHLHLNQLLIVNQKTQKNITRWYIKLLRNYFTPSQINIDPSLIKTVLNITLLDDYQPTNVNNLNSWITKNKQSLSLPIQKLKLVGCTILKITNYKSIAVFAFQNQEEIKLMIIKIKKSGFDTFQDVEQYWFWKDEFKISNILKIHSYINRYRLQPTLMVIGQRRIYEVILERTQVKMVVRYVSEQRMLQIKMEDDVLCILRMNSGSGKHQIEVVYLKQYKYEQIGVVQVDNAQLQEFQIIYRPQWLLKFIKNQTYSYISPYLLSCSYHCTIYRITPNALIFQKNFTTNHHSKISIYTNPNQNRINSSIVFYSPQQLCFVPICLQNEKLTQNWQCQPLQLGMTTNGINSTEAIECDSKCQKLIQDYRINIPLQNHPKCENKKCRQCFKEPLCKFQKTCILNLPKLFSQLQLQQQTDKKRYYQIKSQWAVPRQASCENQCPQLSQNGLTFSQNIEEGTVCSYFEQVKVMPNEQFFLIVVSIGDKIHEFEMDLSLCIYEQDECQMIQPYLKIKKSVSYGVKIKSFYRLIVKFPIPLSLSQGFNITIKQYFFDDYIKVRWKIIQIILTLFAICLLIVSIIFARKYIYLCYYRNALNPPPEIFQIVQTYPLTQRLTNYLMKSHQQNHYIKITVLEGQKQEECVFCLQRLQLKIVRVFCGHQFHFKCFWRWCQVQINSKRCAMCNRRFIVQQLQKMK